MSKGVLSTTFQIHQLSRRVLTDIIEKTTVDEAVEQRVGCYNIERENSTYVVKCCDRRLVEFPSSEQLAGRALQYATWAPSAAALVSIVHCSHHLRCAVVSVVQQNTSPAVSSAWTL